MTSQIRKRVTWTVTATCYPDDLQALIDDASALMYDGLMGGYALDVDINLSVETFEDEDA